MRKTNRRGQGVSEYAVIVSIVALVVIASLTIVSGAAGGVFATISSSVANVGATPTPTTTPAPSSANAAVDDSTPSAGDNVTVTLSGFDAATGFTLALNPGGSSLGAGTTDGTGAASIIVTIPVGATPGAYTIDASGTVAGVAGGASTLPITVSSANVASLAWGSSFGYPGPLGISATASNLTLSTGASCTIEKTSLGGSNVSGFGTGGSGLANGTYSTSARKNAVFSGGYLWVYDNNLHELLKLDPTSMLAVDHSAPFAWGLGAGNIINGWDLAADANYVYVLGSSNNRVTKIDKSTMAYVTASAPLDETSGIATDGTYVYITQLTGSTRYVAKLQSSDLSQVGTFGTYGFGPGAGQFGTPEGIILAGADLVVFDASRPAFVKFNAAAFNGSGWLVGPSVANSGIDDVAYDPTLNQIWATIWGQNTIETFNPATLASTGTSGAFGGGRTFEQPATLAFNGTDAYIFEANRSLWSRVTAASLALSNSAGDCLGSSNGSDPTKTVSSYGGDIARAGGNLYVADQSANRIVKLNATSLAYQDQATSADSLSFSNPTGIASDGTYVYVADSGNGRVVKLLASDLSFVSSATSANSTNFSWPEGMTVNDGKLFLADSGNNRLVEMNSNLGFIAAVGDDGGGDSLSWPQDVASDGSFLYVTDGDNGRIVMFDQTTMTWSNTFGAYGQGTGQFDYPNFLTVSGSKLFVTDTQRVITLNIN